MQSLQLFGRHNRCGPPYAFPHLKLLPSKMPNPRSPLAKAKATGQANKNPQRFKDRKEPRVSTPIGAAPRWMNAGQRKAWDMFCGELFWLNYSHRAILEIACTVRAKIYAGEDCSVAALTLLRQALGQLGATPATASVISMPEKSEEDPAEKYFR